MKKLAPYAHLIKGVAGIVSALSGWAPVAMVLGIMAIRESQKDGAEMPGAGLTTGIISVVIGAASLVVVVMFFIIINNPLGLTVTY